MRLTQKKKWCTVFCASLAAGAVFMLLLAIQGIFPFGASSILRNDASSQYAPLLNELINRFKSGSSLLYSFSDGAGSNFFATICYYLINPFNLVALLFKQEHIDKAFELIIFLQTICVAASFGYYITEKFKKSGVAVVVFSLLYTFCGFYMAYYYNTMWLNVLILLPLVALGIERLVQGKSGALYLIALTLAILTNFYMGYMLCIFSVLYFFMQLFANPLTSKEQKALMQEQSIGTVLFKYGAFSLFSGLISAVVLLPVFCAVQASTAKAVFTDNTMFFNFLDFLTAHLNGIDIAPLVVTQSTLPNVSVGMLGFCLLPLYFFTKKIPWNEKVAYAVLLLLLLLSFQLPQLNMLWHGFAAPSWLPYRFAYIYSFLVLVLAYKTFLHIKEVPIWAFSVPVVLAAGAIIYTQFSEFEPLFSTKTLLVSGIAAGVYLLFLILKKYEKLNKKVLSALLLAAVMAETAVGQFHNFYTVSDSLSTMYPNIEQMQQASADLKTSDSELFYRTEASWVPHRMDFPGAFYNTNSVTIFSSLSDSRFSATQYGLGISGNLQNSYAYTAQTPIYNAMFNIKYVLDVNGCIDKNSPYYEEIGEYDGYTLYRNTHTLPLGFVISEEATQWHANGLAFVNQNNLWMAMTDAGIAFETIAPTSVDFENAKYVDFDEIRSYLQETAEEDEHDHEDEETHDHLTPEKLMELTAQSGGTYPFKVTADNYSMEFIFTAEKTGEMYLLQEAGSFSTMEIVRADGRTTTRSIGAASYEGRTIVDVGYLQAGEQVTVKIFDGTLTVDQLKEEHPFSDSILLLAATLDDAVFQAGYNTLTENGVLTLTEYEEDALKGTVQATRDGMLMLSMPYDKGWRVWVDGVETELTESESHIMMLAVAAGEHTIEMRYVPVGLKEGAFVSAASLAALLLVVLLLRVRKNREPEFDGPQENPDARYVRKPENSGSAGDEVSDVGGNSEVQE